MKIGIFGGTFNPFHKGHLGIAKYAKEVLELDEVWLIPTYKTPDKRFDIVQDNPKLRFEIVKKSLIDLNIDWLKVNDIELKLKGTSYTYKTVEILKQRNKNYEFFFILGDDHFKTFETWKKVDEIKKNAQVVFIRRSFKPIWELVNSDQYQYLDRFYMKVSSSDILRTMSWDLINDVSKKYIAKHYLYIKNMVYYELNNGNIGKQNRYIHSLSVANHAKKLAVHYKYYDPTKAYYAGLAHDLFKNVDIEEQYKYVKENLMDGQIMPPNPALHGYYADIWFRKEYQINDSEFCDALRKHTLADENMSLLDKIIFVADKIADDRKGIDVKKYRKFAYKNIDQTYKDLVEDLINKLESKNIEPSPLTLRAREINKL